MITTLEEQLKQELTDEAAMKAEYQRTVGHNNQGRDLSEALARKAVKIQTLRDAIKSTEQAARDLEVYQSSPEYKKVIERISKIETELASLNKKYCTEAQQLLGKIQALHAVDKELVKLKHQTGNKTFSAVLGRGQFTELGQIETGLAQAAEAGRYIASMRAMFQKR